MRYFFIPLLILIFSSCSYHQRNSHRIVSVTPSTTPEVNKRNFQYSVQAYGGRYTLDPELTQYINKIAQNIADISGQGNIKCKIEIVNSSIPNIWSFPNHHIAITRGLLMELQNEAELAAILSHEISHLSNQHGTENIQKIILNAGPVRLDAHSNYYGSDFAVGPLGSGSGLVTLKYDVKSEMNADQMALAHMHELGYSPKAVVDLQNRMAVYHKSQDPNWMGGYLAKHPLTELQISKCLACQKLYHENGKLEAYTFNKKIALLNKQNLAYDTLNNGYQALLDQKYSKAIELANQGFQLEPSESHFLLLKAKAESRLGHMMEALKTLNAAIAINPFYFDNYLQRGLVKEQLDDWAEASKDLEISLTLLPTAEAYYALGEIDYSKERQAEAVEYFRKASISGSPGGKKALKKLQKLGLPLSGLQTLEVKPQRTESGHLNLEVKNKGSEIARSIVIDIEQLDPSGKRLFRHFVQIQKDLQPNETVCQQTNIGPFFSDHHLNQSTVIYPVYCE